MVKYFSTSVIEANLPEKKKEVFEIVASEGMPKVVKVTTSCSCIKAEYKAKDAILVVSYTPPAVPIHLKKLGHNEYMSTKMVTVTFEDGSKESIIVKGKIYGS